MILEQTFVVSGDVDKAWNDIHYFLESCEFEINSFDEAHISATKGKYKMFGTSKQNEQPQEVYLLRNDSTIELGISIFSVDGVQRKFYEKILYALGDGIEQTLKGNSLQQARQAYLDLSHELASNYYKRETFNSTFVKVCVIVALVMIATAMFLSL